MDNFMIQALLAGCGIAIALGPLGCLVIWRRMAFVGDTLSHASLLGFALSLCWQLPLWPAVLGVAGFIGAFLGLQLTKKGRLVEDAWLGVLSYSSLAIALLLLSFYEVPLLDFNSYLFGDLLAVDIADVITMWVIAVFIVGFLGGLWRFLIAATVDPDLASLELPYIRLIQILFMIILAMAIALALKVVGGLMVGALLLLPVMTLRGWVQSAQTMAISASLLGCLFVLTGGWASLVCNAPTGPAIVIAGLGGLIISKIIIKIKEA